MPSSVIVGALVLAWLVVLVPMIARKRQEVARTADSALAARVVRSGTVHRGTEEARAMADAGTGRELRAGTERSVPVARTGRRTTSKYYDDYDYYETDGYPELDDAYLGGDTEHRDDDLDYQDDEPRRRSERHADAERDDPAGDRGTHGEDHDRGEDHDTDDHEDAGPHDEDDEFTDELPLPEEHEPGDHYREPHGRRPRSREFRPGRGGFDPEAAELSKQAKYAFRRRVVLGMVIAVLVAALVAMIAFRPVWWAALLLALSLTGYLVYLRRQVRIEEDIRQRRLSRMRATGWTVPELADDYDEDYDGHDYNSDDYAGDDYTDEELTTRRRVEADTAHDMLPGFHDETPPQRRVSATPPPAVPGTAVVDVDDDDPAFDDLAEPGSLPYRRAAGE